MPLRPSLPWLLTTLAAALVAMTLAAGAARKTESAIAAAAFVLIVVAAAVLTNAPLWGRTAERAPNNITARDALRPTAQLVMFAYVWCALAFYTIYLGTQVRWQHGWEYGSALMVIGLAHAFYLWRLSDPNDSVSAPASVARAVRLASYQAVAIAVGLIWLIQSGKLSTLKGDWAANQLFLAGGFAIMFLSVIIIKTYVSLREAHAR